MSQTPLLLVVVVVVAAVLLPEKKESRNFRRNIKRPPRSCVNENARILKLYLKQFIFIFGVITAKKWETANMLKNQLIILF